jgi:7-cyano-7-deazaguanine synthase
MSKKILVLHSGGMDSTVCLYREFAEPNSEVVSLGIDYGQRHSVEMLFASKQCAIKNIERQVINVNWEKPARELPVGRTIRQIKNEPSPAFLPSRNLVFLALGSAHAAGVGAEELHIGINSIDFSGYPDCTPAFFDAFSNVHTLAGASDVRIIAPLLSMTKPSIATLAASLGICRTDTWSCYRPKIDGGKVTPCGECDACKLHEYAWKNMPREL